MSDNMTLRSLVGMSQRRRKELFHVEFEAAREKDGTVSMFIADALLCKYRIGQRLRLCPGCKTCGYEPTVKMWKLSRDALWMSGRLGVRDIRHICDGSGVLPAKGKVRR